MAKKGSATAACLTAVAALVAVVAALLAAVLHNEDVADLFDRALDEIQGGEAWNLQENRYLLGNFRPTADESAGVALEVIEGAVPEGLEGLYLRVGPNPVPSHGFKKRYHVFDGHGHLHSVRFRANAAPVYSNQWLQTPRYLKENEVGREFFPKVGQLHGWVGLVRVLTTFGTKMAGLSRLEVGQANTNMFVDAVGRLFALHEGSLPFEVAYDDSTHTFAAKGYLRENGTLDYPVSAHPKRDHRTGEVFAHGYDPMASKTMKYAKWIGERLVVYEELNTNAPTWAHDMMISDTHCIFIESSIHFTGDVLKGVFFDFVDKPLRLGLLPRNASTTADMQWFSAGRALAIVHPMNAWTEENGDVVLYTPMGEDFDGSLTKGGNVWHLTRVTFHVGTGELTVEKLNDVLNVEFPRVHPNMLGHKTEYGFAGTMEKGDLGFTGIARFHLPTGRVQTIMYDSDCIGGEPVPIPKPGREDASDAVYLVGFVHNEASGESEVHLYDGETMDEKPVVRLRVPKRVPYGFHGEWVPEPTLQMHLNYNNA